MTMTIGDYIKKLEDEVSVLKSKLDDVLNDQEMVGTCIHCMNKFHIEDLNEDWCEKCEKKEWEPWDPSKRGTFYLESKVRRD
jgi:hypothetical protein